jgi:ribosomal-protein-alanine N-acetyltransferase
MGGPGLKRMPFPSFTTARLRLRPIAKSDAKGLHAAFGDPEAMRFWDSRPSRSVDETKRWIPKSTPHFGMWAVLTKDGKRFLGMVNFHARNAAHRRLAIGYILARDHWRKGFMHEALVPFIGYCFGTLGCHRVEALIEPANAASKALAEKLGFRAEGVLRDRLCVEGEFRSVAMYALFAPDWFARYPKPQAARKAKAKR